MKNIPLTFLCQSITSIPAVGDKTAEKLANLIGGRRIFDLLLHLPIDIVDRSYSPQLKDLEVGKVATLKVKVVRHIEGFGFRAPFKVVCEDLDETGRIYIPFFKQKNSAWVKDKFPLGQIKVISGKTEAFRNEIHMPHPDYVVDENFYNKVLIKEPVYPLTAGITNRFIRSCIARVLKRLEELLDEYDFDEWQDRHLQDREEWEDLLSCLKTLHNPTNHKVLSPNCPARKRIAYDEILSSQLALAILHHKERELKGVKNKGTGEMTERLVKSLPFEMTGAQKRATDDILHDMALSKRMLRLLQGDVGSGKTIVAVLASLRAIESGGQALIMAPTDILSQQHYKGIYKMLSNAGLLDKVQIEVLTGRDKGQAKKDKLLRIASGQTNLVIGTHSLFQSSTEFRNLTLAVIDEQHRFGVAQRLELVSKSKENPCDILAMSATPIPRTLTMTIYGDMDLSIIDELPANRKPITTNTVSDERLEELILNLKKLVESGQKVYWVCPLVEESEKLKYTAVETRHRFLQKYFDEKVNFIHGKTKKDERDLIMNDFKDKSGTVKLLVATTVIEVGVDVPEASIIVIENAERFGLSQLHQLRGRVGRGDIKSTCVLVYGENLTPIAKQRLNAMKQTQNGFILAEEDLKLRGAGEILGEKQSGVPVFKIADYGLDKQLFYTAKDDVKLIMHNDWKLQNKRGLALMHLLKLYRKDKDVLNILAG